MSASKVVRSSLDLHSNITKLVDGEVFLFDNNPNGILTEELVFSRAVAVLMCASYRNHLVNIYARPALVVLAMQIAQSSRREDVYQMFDFLRNLFSKEFIFFPGFEKKDFEEGCLLLSKCDVVQGSPHEMVLTEKGSNTALFLLRMFQPFFEGYQLAFRHLVEDVTKKWSEKQYISALRSFVTQRIIAETTSCYEALSSDMQKNTLASFVHLGLVKVGKLEGQSTFTVNETTIEEFAGKLGLQVPVEKLLVARL